MVIRKIKTILTVVFFSLVSNVAIGASDIKKVKRLVARLQMELMELKEKASNSSSEQMAILEPQNEKIDRLSKENLEISKKLKDVELKFLLLEEKFEKYKKESSNEQLSELNQLSTILTLMLVGETSSIEPLVLDLINKGNNLKQDLLILVLAENQKKQGLIEESLNYYVLLISEHPKSRYLNRAIFQASELLGKLGHVEDQNNMLEALKDDEGKYGILARKKLGIEELEKEDAESQEEESQEDAGESPDQKDTDASNDQQNAVQSNDQQDTVESDDQQDTVESDDQQDSVESNDQKDTAENNDQNASSNEEEREDEVEDEDEDEDDY